MKPATSKILHLMWWDKKFVPAFVSFINQEFKKEEHLIVIYGTSNGAEMPRANNVVHHPSLLKSSLEVSLAMHSVCKVILHGLFSSHMLYVLTLQPWLLKKCYWTIWGGDLYVHNAERKGWRWRKNEFFRQFVISRLGHFITHIKGDYELAQQWYGAKGEWHECFMYPSNLHQEPPLQSLPHDGINILLGNSADPSNNHIEVLDKLRSHAGENIKIYCPLSYGNQSYAQNVSDYGASIFGKKFFAQRDFMPFEKYKELLAQIDIAVFNHKRQQGMGNATTLLGMGKKVYMRKDVTPYSMFKNLGITVYSIENFDLSPIDDDAAMKNKECTKEFFSMINLISQWSGIYE